MLGDYSEFEIICKVPLWDLSHDVSARLAFIVR